MNKAIQNGVLYDLIDACDIRELIFITSRYTTYSEELIRENINAWKFEKLEADKAYELFSVNKEVLEKHKIDIIKIISKIKLT